jgi:hypothetical protein
MPMLLGWVTGAVGKYLLFGALALVAASSLVSFIKAPLEREIVSLRQAAKDLEKIVKLDSARAEAAEAELTIQKEALDAFVESIKVGACHPSDGELVGLRRLANGGRKH